jgi:N-acetylglutamate synthase
MVLAVDELIRELENRAFAAWPAEEVCELGGWRLRYTRGVTRRANSVWPNNAAGDLSLEPRIDQAERYYRSRGQRPSFQISPLACPPGLDETLAARGYVVDAPVSVEIGGALEAAARPRPGVRVRVEPTLFDDWFELSARRGRYADAAEVYRGLLDRLKGRALFALAQKGGVPAAVAMGVVDGAWMGIFSMRTDPAHRRAGLGRAVLGALAQSAQARGVQRLYLQVEKDNQSARSLYRSAGFRKAYAYHYRIASGGPER